MCINFSLEHKGQDSTKKEVARPSHPKLFNYWSNNSEYGRDNELFNFDIWQSRIKTIRNDYSLPVQMNTNDIVSTAIATFSTQMHERRGWTTRKYVV